MLAEMKLSTIDLSILVGYFILITVVGLLVSKKASGSIKEYFLGGRSIPWYILGLSGMATFVDISGTAFQVKYFYLLGVKGYWVCYMGATALALAFLMIFTGKWLNRSGAMTNAEWMAFRFGNGIQGRLARLLSAISITVIVIAFLAYFFVGAAKTLHRYVPFFDNPNYTALAFFIIVMLYTVAAGFYGVVYTDMIQAFLIIFIVGYITYKAMVIGTPEYYGQYADTGWREYVSNDMNSIKTDFGPLGTMIIIWFFFNNFFQGFATPFDAWTSQRYYAAKDERESSLVACQWISLFSLRFLLMMGFGVLAIGIKDKISDPEMALSAVIDNLIPIGLKGLLLAALLAAAMSTLDSFVNSSAAYFVKDIYQEFINPTASEKELMKASYIVTFTVMVLGIIIGWNVESIGNIWGWICMGLFTGMLVPNILKWFWWRFNGMGFVFGMATGLIIALAHDYVFGKCSDHMKAINITWVSAVGTIIGVYVGKPTGMDVLINFYEKSRPFGFWGNVRRHCNQELVCEAVKENKRDLLLLIPACLWQLTLFCMMTSIVVKRWDVFFVSAFIVAVLSVVLYKYWYKNLKTI